jgi:hypothetical protein
MSQITSSSSGGGGGGIPATTTNHTVQVGNVAGTLTSLAVGTTGKYLRGVTTSDPIWSTLTLPNTVALGDVLVASATNVVGVVNDVANAGYVLTVNVGGAPSFQSPGAGGIGTLAGDSGTATGATVTIAGTTNQITTTAASATVTLSTPSTFIAPGTIEATTTVTAGTDLISTAGNLNFNAASGQSINWPNVGTYGAGILISWNALPFLSTGGSYGTSLSLGRNTSIGGDYNTFIGSDAAQNYTSSATNNTIVGAAAAGQTASSGTSNTIIGNSAFAYGTGSYNTMGGNQSYYAISSGNYNTGWGYHNQAMSNGASGSYNSSYGISYASSTVDGAGSAWQFTESNNVCIQSTGVLGESNTLHIGQATGTGIAELNAAYICGIYGITVTGTPILISATDQLGVAVSSAKYKKDITDMPDMSQVIDKLRPVTFHYKDEKQSAQLNYGLIAEEVEQVWPEMVAYDKDGNISTLYYQFLAPILLKEIQALRKEIEELKRRN